RKTAAARCQNPSAECKSYLELSLKYFPDDPELIKLKTGLPPPVPPPPGETSPDDPKQPLLRKATDAFNAGRYVLPLSESALYYANKVLDTIDSNDKDARWIREN